MRWNLLDQMPCNNNLNWSLINQSLLGPHNCGCDDGDGAGQTHSHYSSALWNRLAAMFKRFAQIHIRTFEFARYKTDNFHLPRSTTLSDGSLRSRLVSNFNHCDLALAHGMNVEQLQLQAADKSLRPRLAGENYRVRTHVRRSLCALWLYVNGHEQRRMGNGNVLPFISVFISTYKQLRTQLILVVYCANAQHTVRASVCVCVRG